MKDADGENVSQPKKVEGKDEEASFQAENSTNTEAALIGSEEKPEGKSDAAVEAKKEEEDNNKASGSDDLVGHGVEEVDDAKKEAETSVTSEQTAEHTGEELKNQADVSNIPVPQSEVVEKPKEDFEESSVQESESEASKRKTISESVTGKAKGEVTEPSTVPSSISEDENIQTEPPMTSTAKVPASEGIETLDTEEGAKNSQDENKNFEETVALENTGEELKNQPQNEVVEKPKEDFEESSVQESESEASKRKAVSESVTEKVKGEVTEPSTVPSSISEEENIQTEPPMASTAKVPASDGIETLGTEESTKNSQDENKNFEETVSLENAGEELKNQPNVSNTPVPQSEVVEKPKEAFEESSAQESESEASTKQAVSESVTEKVKGEVAEPSTVPSSISEEENKQMKPPMVPTAKVPASDGIETLGTEEGAKNSQDENKNFEESVALENTGEELKNQPQNEVVEKPKEAFEESSVQESESEASTKQAVSESVTEKVKGEVAEPSTVPSSISEEENKQMKPPMVPTAKAPASDGIETLGPREGAKNSQDENKNSEETVALENLSAVVTDVAKLQEAGEGAAALEAIDAPQKTDAELNASRDVEESAKEEMGSGKVEKVVKEVAVNAGKPDPSAALELVKAADESSVIKITEDSMKPEAKVEEQKQEKITEVDKPNLSKKSQIDAPSEVAKVAEVAYEGEKVSESTEKVEEKKNERLESNEPTLVGTSKDLKAATEISEVPSEERKVSEGADMVADKDENLKGKEEITRDLDAASIVAEAASQEEKASKGAAVFEETNHESLKDKKVSGLEISKDFDAASEVAELSSQEKVSAILETVAEKKEESLESDKTTSIETSKSSDAAAVSFKDEKSSTATEMVDKKDNSLEGDKPTLVETSKDLDVVSDISGVPLVEEKTSGGTEMVQEKDEKEKSPEGTETINEKKNEALEGARKTLGETFKEHDMAEKNIISASAAEPVADSQEIEKDKELAKDLAETGKPDDGNAVEPSKDGDVTKQEQEAPKQEVRKASRHHSSNILSKMKRLIVKAKKVILGKSPSSKTMSAGTKDDIKVK